MLIIKNQDDFDKKVKWFGDRGRLTCQDVLFLCPIDATDITITAKTLIKYRGKRIKGLTKTNRTVII
jgi:hypothetical protein